MSAEATRGDEQLDVRARSYMEVLTPAAASGTPVQASPNLHSVEGEQAIGTNKISVVGEEVDTSGVSDEGAARADATIRAPPALHLAEGEGQPCAEPGVVTGEDQIQPPPDDGALPAADANGEPNPVQPNEAANAEPELNKDTPLEELREVVERRKHLKEITASGLYSDDEITSIESMPVDTLRTVAEAAGEKAQLLAQLDDLARKRAISCEVVCKLKISSAARSDVRTSP